MVVKEYKNNFLLVFIYLLKEKGLGNVKFIKNTHFKGEQAIFIKRI